MKGYLYYDSCSVRNLGRPDPPVIAIVLALVLMVLTLLVIGKKNGSLGKKA